MSDPITLEYRRRHWTIVCDGKPLVTFPSFAEAIQAVPEAIVKYDSETLQCPEAIAAMRETINAWHARNRRQRDQARIAAILNPPDRVEPEWALPMNRAELIALALSLAKTLRGIALSYPATDEGETLAAMARDELAAQRLTE